mgnify:CR=1 FL=1
MAENKQLGSGEEVPVDLLPGAGDEVPAHLLHDTDAVGEVVSERKSPSTTASLIGGGQAGLIAAGRGVPKGVLTAGKRVLGLGGDAGKAPPPYAADMSGTDRWMQSASDINEKAKIVRRNTELAKRYPQFTREGTPTAPTTGQRVLKAAETVPGKAFISGYNATDALQRMGSDDALSNVQAVASTEAALAPWIANMIPNKKLRSAVRASQAIVPAVNIGIDRARDALENKAAGGVIQGYANKGQVQGGLSTLKKLSDVLIPHEGKTLLTTAADRTKAVGGFHGGPGFIDLNPNYTWAVDAPGVVEKHLNAVNRFGGPKQTVFAPMLMSETAHRSNRPVFEQIYGDLAEKIRSGQLTPQQIEAINARIASDKSVNLANLPSISDPAFLNAVDTFQKRGRVADILGQKRLGGVDLPKHLESTIDPELANANLGAVAPQLFTIHGAENKPGIHPAYNWMFMGEKGGQHFTPVDRSLIFRDLEKQAREQMGRGMTDYNYRNITKEHGLIPNQLIDEDLIRSLKEAGHAEGGAIRGYADAGKVLKAAKAGLEALEPKKTVKAYKLFKTDAEGNLFPLFVNANKPVPMGEWLKAEAGPLTERGKVKSKIGELAYRPGWHSGEFPVATHIGGKSSNELTGPDFRPSDQVWAEVEHPADVDWQSIANARARIGKSGKPVASTAHITDQIPFGGNYRYRTNENMTGDWYISGDMKVNRVLPDEEVMRINEESGIFDLPRFQPLDKKAEGGLACLKEGGRTPAWQRKEGKNPEGGLNAKGRASYNRETGGNLKRPQPEGGKRRDSFCARMKGMKKKLTSAETANDPDSRINKSLRAWNC